ncbi:MAG: DNA polymerase III subunit alpha [Hyphomicrobiaceae bacterium]|nr:DNA polymerase III subunit alpha [Hyphomicrobiaceae bacterium]
MNAPIRDVIASGERAAVELPPFIHLRVHSAYSLLEGALPIPTLAKLAQKMRLPALGISDTNNLFGALEFAEKLAGVGVQPIVGVTLAVDFGDRRREVAALAGRAAGVGDGMAQRPFRDGRLALIAATAEGYGNLMKIVSTAHLGVADGEPPHVDTGILAERSAGIIALTGGPDGPVDGLIADADAARGTAGGEALARARLKRLADIYGDRLYVEVQRHGTASERAVEPRLLALAYELALPLVATNEAYFAGPDDYEAHDALICIAEGRYVVEDNRRRLTGEHYLKTPADMAVVFADLPEALANTIEIARRCTYRPLGRKPILPRFVASAAGKSDGELLAEEAGELKRQAEVGLARRLAAHGPAPGFTEKDYADRLAYEVEVIAGMKFPGYFLIVADFIQWSKAQGIPVGPGRGSGAGSLVAYALTITDLDPLRFGLLFERFLNPERVSMPDFDIDFCQDRREETIRYVQGKYGHDRVAQIITHGKLQARAVLRDVGRVLQMSYGQVDQLTKLVPNNPANPVTLAEAIAGEPKLQEAIKAEPIVAQLVEKAQKLEGLYRHASTHAAGMVIGDRPLDELVPLYRDPKSSMPVTQFNWKMVEAAGLVKFDFLGLKTLTVLKKAVDLVRKGRGIAVDLDALPLTDAASYGLLARADTVGVFQLESTGMRESLKRLKPDRFEDIIAMVALYRPGPMDNIPTYINRKHGEEPVDCLHPMLEGILKETYGVIIYQEQVIQIAQVMGGYTLGQADMLRRAMGKKDKEEMARHQARFVAGAKERGVRQKDAEYIFELVNKFAGYGFNKSHAAAYALVSYQTAYMKANYCEEFLAASMTLDLANTDKLAVFAAEARRCGIPVLPPCVNSSEVEFAVEVVGMAPAPSPREREAGGVERLPAARKPRSNAAAHPGAASMKDGERGSRRAIRYALAGLKNVGQGAVETIVAERRAKGAFSGLADFARRLNPRAVNKRAIEMMAMAGAFDALEANRAAITANADQVMALAQRVEQDAATGMTDMFGGGDGAKGLELRTVSGWTPLERLEEEFRAIGFYLSGHPLDSYRHVLDKLGARTFAEIHAASEQGAVTGKLAAIVVSARERRNQKGSKYAFGLFSDPTGQFEAVIFSEPLAAAGDLLVAGTPVVLTVQAEREGETLKVRVAQVQALDVVAAGVERGLRVAVDPTAGRDAKAMLAKLRSALQPVAAGRAGGEIRIVLPIAERSREIELKLKGKFDVTPTAAGRIAALPGVISVADV